MVERNRRKVLVGNVISRSGDKSVRVLYSYKKPHSLYKKEIKRKTILHVHDEENQCKVGDQVKVMQTRPLSKLKCWRVISVMNSSVIDVEETKSILAVDENVVLSSDN